MLGFLKDLFSEETNNESQEKSIGNIPSDMKVQIATCALFLEIANSDDEFSAMEQDAIFSIMKRSFNLSDVHVAELIQLSKEQVQKSISLYEFTDIINQQFSDEKKYEVVKNLWRLIFVDNKLHSYEEYFIRKINQNLRLSHKDLMAAKIEVKHELGIK